MINVVLSSIVLAVLFMSFFILVFVLFKCRSSKKNYFVLLQMATIIFLAGHLLELTSDNADEAYTALKILYAGAFFVATFTFFFVADYCDVRLHPVFIKAPMLVFTTACIIFMWTTKFHHLVYIQYSFDRLSAHYLDFEPGVLYSVFHIYPPACLAGAVAMIVLQMRKWKGVYRRQLAILLICAVIPFSTEAVYFLTIITGINKLNIYFTPHSIAIMNCFLYLGLMRFNIFEIIPAATISAMDHITEGFILVDADDNYLSSNQAALEALPGIGALVKGESIFNAQGWPGELTRLETGSADFSVTRQNTRYFNTSVSPVIIRNGILQAKIILFRDISAQVTLMKQLENAAYTDALTGLYNRRHFFELAAMTIERSRRLNTSIYAAMIDLDFFKKVNDAYGHAAGDLVLKYAAEAIRQTVRSYDIVGRYGGEEFALILTDTELDGVQGLLERIRHNVAGSVIKYGEADIKITCSVGFARFSGEDTLETAIVKADRALYDVKENGRNQVKMY